MEKKIKKRTAVVFAALFILVIGSFLVNILVGNVGISLREIAEVFAGTSDNAKIINIIMTIRLPRAVMALILGGALAVSGFLLQTYFANPIAGPYILGISSGAKMVVAITLIFFAGKVGRVSNLLLVFAAFIGAITATGFIIMISKKVRNMSALLAAGIMIGYICSAITDFLVTFAEDSDIVNLHSWSQGSFSGANAEGALFSVIIVGITFAAVVLFSKTLDAFRLGEGYARSVGVNVRLCRIVIIVLSGILSACVTAFAGPVSFIGIAVPYLMREVLKSSKPILLIPASFLSGAVFCMLSDLLARMLFAPTEMNISAVTSLFGAPIVIIMIVRRGKSR